MSITTRRIGPGRGEGDLWNYVRALERRVAALEGRPSAEDAPATSEPKARETAKTTSKKRKGSAADAEV